MRAAAAAIAAVIAAAAATASIAAAAALTAALAAALTAALTGRWLSMITTASSWLLPASTSALLLRLEGSMGGCNAHSLPLLRLLRLSLLLRLRLSLLQPVLLSLLLRLLLSLLLKRAMYQRGDDLADLVGGKPASRCCVVEPRAFARNAMDGKRRVPGREAITRMPRVTTGSMVRRACHVSPRGVW